MGEMSRLPAVPDRSLERRGFLGILTWVIGGLITLAFAVPGVGYQFGLPRR